MPSADRWATTSTPAKPATIAVEQARERKGDYERTAVRGGLRFAGDEVAERDGEVFGVGAHVVEDDLRAREIEAAFEHRAVEEGRSIPRREAIEGAFDRTSMEGGDGDDRARKEEARRCSDVWWSHEEDVFDGASERSRARGIGIAEPEIEDVALVGSERRHGSRKGPVEVPQLRREARR